MNMKEKISWTTSLFYPRHRGKERRGSSQRRLREIGWGMGEEEGQEPAGGVIMKAKRRKYSRTMSNITNITICHIGNA